MITGRVFLLLCLLLSLGFGLDYTEDSELKNNKIDETALVGSNLLLFSDSSINIRSEGALRWGHLAGLALKPREEKIPLRETLIQGDESFLIWDYSSKKGELLFQLVDTSDFSSSEVLLQFKGAPLDSIDNIFGVKGVFGGGKFYVPTYRCGIVVVNPETASIEAIIDLDSTKKAPVQYSFDIKPESVRPRVVLYRQDTLFVASSDTVVRMYDIVGDTWSQMTIPDTKGKSLMIAFDGSGALISYTTFIDTDDRETQILERIGATPKTLFEGAVAEFKYDEDGSLYVMHGDSIQFSIFNANDSLTTEGTTVVNSVRSNKELNNAKMTDFSVANNRLLLGTNQGAVYFADFTNGAGTYETFRKDRPMSGSLKEVYAAPSIITDESGAIIEYSLAEDDRVTIDIFDTNLDFVCRLVDNEPRPAGGDKHSTDRARDRWDGSFGNNGGETVAPGVYYFKLVAEKGGRAFGKVIVAKN